MKTGIALFALLTAVVSVQAQEYDDMYFKSKDRAKLNGEKVAVVKSAQSDEYTDDTQTRINPTDSYSGRGVNPEYSSGSNDGAQEDADYFISGYEPTGVNRSLPSYGSNSFYGPYYGNDAFASSFYGYGSGFGYTPVFANPYSSFANSFYWNSFYPGMSLGYNWGMGAGYYGMNMGYGMWNSSFCNWGYGFGGGSYFGGWGSPYSGFAYSGYPYYGGFYGYGGYYGYPSTIVVINNNNGEGRGYTYGKRGSRSSTVNNQAYNGNADSRGRTRSTVSNNTASNSGGRSSTASQSQYYQSGWRSNPDVQRNIIGGGSNSGRSSSWSGSGGSSSWRGGSNGSGWGGNSNSGRSSSWDNNGGGFNNNSNSGGFGGRSGGGSIGGGGSSHSSGGGSRGRH